MTDPLALLRAYQAGRCAMCTYARPLLVDHDHTTGLVRGFLCSSCNATEGKFDYPWIVAYRLNPPAKRLGLYVAYSSRGWHRHVAPPGRPLRRGLVVTALALAFGLTPAVLSGAPGAVPAAALGALAGGIPFLVHVARARRLQQGALAVAAD